MVTGLPSLNLVSIVVAALVAFVEGALWNSPFLFGTARLRLAGLDREPELKMTPARPLAELVRCLILTCALVAVFRIADITGLPRTWGFATLIWFGFQANLLFGGVVWERMPVRLYAIHAGDALVKALIVATIIQVWR